MSTRHLVDPAVLPTLEAFPSLDLSYETLPAQRRAMAEMAGLIETPTLPISRREIHIAAPNAPDVRAILLTPEGLVAPAPAILHIHGGAYVLGAPEMNVADLMVTANMLGAIVLTVDYRLAPEAPFPSGIEDCYSALGWLHDNASSLGIDSGRIAVMGESAGGGLAASLALMARDRGEYPLAFQLLDAPMMDDRTCVRPHNPATGEFIFTPTNNHFGWKALIGGEPGRDDVSPYAAAARAQDLAGLAPAYLVIGTLDLFLDETVDYAMRLNRAGVPVELQVYPGCPHGYSIAREAPVSLRAMAEKRAALKRALVD